MIRREGKSEDYSRGYHDAKHYYFHRINSYEFWKAAINDDGPEGLAYAKEVLVHLKMALEEVE